MRPVSSSDEEPDSNLSRSSYPTVKGRYPNNVKKYRLAKNMTQKELGRLWGDITQAEVGRRESGVRPFTLAMLEEVSRILDVEPHLISANAPPDTETWQIGGIIKSSGPERLNPRDFTLVPGFGCKSYILQGKRDAYNPQFWGVYDRRWLTSVTAAPKGQLVMLSDFGDEMSPTVRSRDRLLIDLTVQMVESDGLYAIKFPWSDAVFLRRIRRSLKDGSLSLIVDSGSEPPQDNIAADAISIVGRAILAERLL